MVRKITFRTSWCRKSYVGGEYPYDVSYDPSEAEQKTAEVIKVSQRVFSKIAKTLDDMPKSLSRMDVFVVTDGTRYLAVDPQGFDYPRYKGIVVVKGKGKPTA